MGLLEQDKKKALAIVRVFETGKPTGDYGAVAVLDDGAGVSYGVNQFTHRSGALALVVKKYLESSLPVGRTALSESLPLLAKKTAPTIKRLASDDAFKKALKAAAITREMRVVQDEVAEQLYLKPALDACGEMGFVMPLSLAVVYDSMNHGGWERIRARVRVGRLETGMDAIRVRGVRASHLCGQECPRSGEKAWIAEYVRERDAWLGSVKRLAATRYRTRFFLNQIAISNWELRLPVTVHGVRLTDDLVSNSAVEPAVSNKKDPSPGAAGQSSENPWYSSLNNACPQEQAGSNGPQTQAQPPDHCLDAIEETVNEAAVKYDRVESAVEKVITRTDSAKSLWTTVVGTVTQAAWAVGGLLAGVPREVWLVVAVIAAALMLGYLYRQIALGKIRELRNER